MSRFFLVRHGAHDYLGKVLVGRSGGVHLNALGHRQADWLAHRLAAEPVLALYSSPLDRTLETAVAISSRLGLKVSIEGAFNEIDFGRWTNRSFAQLETDPAWGRFNALRSVAHPPGGESMLQVQHRAISKIEEIRREMPNSTVAVVSHADTIKGILSHALGIPLDLFQRIEVSPGSMSILELTESRIRLEALNVTEPVPGPVSEGAQIRAEPVLVPPLL